MAAGGCFILRSSYYSLHDSQFKPMNARPADFPAVPVPQTTSQAPVRQAPRQPPAPPQTRAADLSNARKYLIFGVMAFGQFMALLDIQIVAASLNEVQAGLSAAPEEISWVQTGYLMAELVMIPLSAFLAQALSTRWLFTLSAALFTLS